MTHAVLLLGPRAPEALAQAVRSLPLSPVVMGRAAAEVHLPEDQAGRLAAALSQAKGFDVAVVPLERREKKLLVCDMDATIIAEESLNELAEVVGLKKEISKLTEKAMRGEIGFEEALRVRVALLKGLDIAAASAALKPRINVNPGAEVLVRTMKARGAGTALLTGGFDIIAAPIAERLGFRDMYCNRLQSADGVLTGEVGEPIFGREGKEERLRALADASGITPEDVVCVGDGANDLGMIRAAGLGVGYRPKPLLEAEADVVLRYADLTALLSIQGIKEDDWS
ncbi:phosphoserine phosphatase SerB [Parvularcula maris]|uniref:Phosphoserine phosphatase n=1 Tax=Parvularcula maris TaxID=2965077 RepID=A0A9X2RHZ0_9PROT|nr:phosphoserine phosphatase SerB [Parvularcula maris]MCQ8185475.1 phosphoserine phosphatase SerB [Parvularcula maris]